ncbi:amino acid ABC transporter permease [Helicobacter aurati]|uniref:Amino acid ABC transporter permease n=2 Tax=Helicobacter aurati TaxID=137778 RepID=A0A3D8J2B3_9HELI|nr:amino acid ABC transporter permease [Helicobacter aurati]RDU71285.1 amino acid ABC transporter permease [Helicobacter aurati]
MYEIFTYTTALRIMQAIITLLSISIVSILFSILGGIILGRLMIAQSIVVRVLCRFFVESVRIIPLIAWLFLVYYGIASNFDIHISATLSGIIVFSMWGIAEMGDLVRGSILAIPKHQRESGLALGLTLMQIELFIILPQAIKSLIPSSINLFGRIIKTTSLLPLIGVVEILKVSQQLIETMGKHDTHISFYIYTMTFVLYFLLCYPFSYLGNYLEKKLQ